MSETLTSLRQFHNAVVADLRAHYGDRVLNIMVYDWLPERTGQDRVPITTPAILLGIDSIDCDESDDDGTDRTPLRLMCTADCVLSTRTDDLDLELREFAAATLARIRHNRWGLGRAVHRPEALNAQPAVLDPAQAGYGIWRALWEQVVYLGPDVWAGTGTPPQEVWLGFAPRIGAAYVDDYIRVDEAPA